METDAADQPPPPLVRTVADRNDPAFAHAPHHESRTHSASPEVVAAMVYLPESDLIVTRGHDKVQVTSGADLSAIRAFGPRLSLLRGMKDRSNNGALAVMPDEKTVVVTDDEGNLLFFDIETGNEVGSFSGDGEALYRTFLDGRVMALQLAENARPPSAILFRVPGLPVDIQLRDDGRTAWVGVAEGPIPLSLWDLETRQPLWMADAADLPVWRALSAFNPALRRDGKGVRVRG